MASSSAPSANIGATPQPDSPAAPTQIPEKVSADDQKKSATTTAPNNAPSSAENPAQQQRTNNNDDDDDDDESEFDELDEVLDDFKPKPSPAPAKPDAAQPSAPDDFDEEAFLRQLEQDMANMMGGGGGASNDAAAAAAAAGATDTNDGGLDKDAEAFAKILEESGVSPSDFLKQLVGDVMMKGDDDNSTTAATAGSSAAPAPAASSTPSTSGTAAAPETFNDTIQRTIERMKESGDKATAAASEDDMSDDLVAQLIKAIEAGASSGEGGDEGDLTKMFMGMMEQLSNKEILYEPIKELDTKFGPWIKENKGKGKVSDEDMARYERQAGVVRQIVSKFEEKGYSDEDPKCREYVWEKMQEMQAAGNPPDELISAPWMEDLKGPGGGAGAGGMPDCPQQ
ncbi:peroxisome chaperone and import receptor [Aspergillus tubingensis]|uniref:Peroxisomal membrane protein receptor Pex19 n=2 Tax=Aspergillus subgen. Circumdati TaxID=2720871 RepID=A0A100I485_ASPNG|nr:peroxisomal membrane protein receptor Pex19 [Aspergillus niger]GLA64336.1 peroxisome chaperone and import receptor [Aspergillus tubingensis]GLA68924.1 peroxisome chaperone and import receptor [Aspergillus tubingensis]GLA85588.1 peroxisome chaperone and import receptor [Aspergillus tubingensis]GLA91062.1 peroxisome chaperone and import receptor [Aspergillus tubingensis]